NELKPGGEGATGEQPGLEKEQQQQRRQDDQLLALMEQPDLEVPQRPHSLGSNMIQESADYVLQLLHAYAAAFGL
ncbi:hypothetical protein KR074_004380, partial [Drosophila pseudoananassae]